MSILELDDAYEAKDETAIFLVQTWKELKRARAKFPGDNVTMLALMEEVGELAKASFQENPLAVYAEAVQVACVAARMATEGDGTIIAWRKEKGLEPLPLKFGKFL